MTDFRHAWLSGTSQESDSVHELVNGGEFDVLLTSSSWDARCLCLVECEIHARRALGIFFTNRGTGRLRDQHDPQVAAFIERVGDVSHEIHRGSEELANLWTEIWAEVKDEAETARRPLRVLLDLSTCPRYYAMALIAAGFRSHLVGEMVVFYADGRYPPRAEENPHELFTFGRWETVPVPLLEGRSDPGLPRHYVVSLGFEGSKTVRAVSSEGADNVTGCFHDLALRPNMRQGLERKTRSCSMTSAFGTGTS